MGEMRGLGKAGAGSGEVLAKKGRQRAGGRWEVGKRRFRKKVAG